MYKIRYAVLVLVIQFFLTNSIYAQNISRVGFVSTYKHNAVVRNHEAGTAGLMSFLAMDKKINIDSDINKTNYNILNSLFEKSRVKLIRISVTDKDKELFDMGNPNEKLLKSFVKNISTKNKLDKLIVLNDDDITHSYRFYYSNQFGGGYTWRKCDMDGYGYFSLSGSDTNNRLKMDRLLFSYMTGRLLVFDSKSQELIIRKNLKYIKESIIKNSYSKQYRDKLYSYIADGTSSLAMRKYKKLIYSKVLDKKKIITEYTKDNASVDEFDDWLDKLKILLFDKYEIPAHFDILPDSVSKQINKNIYESQVYIMRTIIEELGQRNIKL